MLLHNVLPLCICFGPEPTLHQSCATWYHIPYGTQHQPIAREREVESHFILSRVLLAGQTGPARKTGAVARNAAQQCKQEAPGQNSNKAYAKKQHWEASGPNTCCWVQFGGASPKK